MQYDNGSVKSRVYQMRNLQRNHGSLQSDHSFLELDIDYQEIHSNVVFMQDQL
ncbi:hypothetical protein DAPPUDRAFT_323434 [Daphnia pulex]|uniref:Uncharacterized protein n=1 Tax=Daphnia pulex TaxID=6669 RepID=E9GYV2_DAPPU|nr:hypothetical protein DAPPUDRAFT_323434 [Daphnia pulex]|eukprot:EFX75222.1 hypothetical protein DAPPUDRAFT_323434 [Daphnia pulex]